MKREKRITELNWKFEEGLENKVNNKINPSGIVFTILLVEPIPIGSVVLNILGRNEPRTMFAALL